MKFGGRQLRHELKYIITYPQYYELLGRLKPFMRRDGEFEDGYLVRSLYFDDMYNTAYYQKEAGILSAASIGYAYITTAMTEL